MKLLKYAYEKIKGKPAPIITTIRLSQLLENQ